MNVLLYSQGLLSGAGWFGVGVAVARRADRRRRSFVRRRDRDAPAGGVAPAIDFRFAVERAPSARERLALVRVGGHRALERRQPGAVLPREAHAKAVPVDARGAIRWSRSTVSDGSTGSRRRSRRWRRWRFTRASAACASPVVGGGEARHSTRRRVGGRPERRRLALGGEPPAAAPAGGHLQSVLAVALQAGRRPSAARLDTTFSSSADWSARRGSEPFCARSPLLNGERSPAPAGQLC